MRELPELDPFEEHSEFAVMVAKMKRFPITSTHDPDPRKELYKFLTREKLFIKRGSNSCSI
ncbi:hypothetical protein AKJ42_01895 [candidate division MSBL1 archaeon SCGC-AAA261C02]|uniref:Uncharacterized protein n=1 Tax=candidate division MSBL1 archaeon SCGC-AAA261C02 TaxID=1698272 RepID=A0A133V0N9_9EURY|nr:hypothetical protein AKJ42_01895 [candidate division MSBL1 archaeon SCGC-AAA261C02]